MLLAAIFIFTNSVTFFLIQYDRMRPLGEGLEGWVRHLLSGAEPAPSQYRIAMPLLAHFLSLHAHLRANQSFPLVEFLAYGLTLTLLYILFRGSPQVQHAPSHTRLILLGFFFAAAQLPILWIFPWERFETLPTAFYLAAIVLLVVRRGRIPFVIVCLLALVLSIVQALVRADVTFAAGVAVLLAAVVAAPSTRPRVQVATLGLLCAGAGAAVQFYLQHVVYPQATYPPGVPMFQLLANLNVFIAPIHVPEFLVALLPLIVCLIFLRRYRPALDFSDRLALLLCLVYLPVWLAFGLVVEMRIYVPYLFLASPTIAKIWTAFLLGDQAGAKPPLSEAQP